MLVNRANTILYCEQWSETVDFYKRIFQFTINHENDWFVEFIVTEGCYLSIADAKRTTIDSVNGQGITLSWQVPDIDAARNHLLDAGVTVTDIKIKWSARLFYLHDPEGHRIEIWQALPQ